MQLKKSYLLVLLFSVTQAIFGQSDTSTNKMQCDAGLWNRVYHPYRFQILEKCRRVTGTVVKARFEADGDAHLLVKLDSGLENLLYPMNYEKQNGLLVVEPVCATLIDGKNPEPECNGYVNKVYLPNIGEHIEIIGSYVLDTKHSWTEIHPVTSITRLKN